MNLPFLFAIFTSRFLMSRFCIFLFAIFTSRFLMYLSACFFFFTFFTSFCLISGTGVCVCAGRTIQRAGAQSTLPEVLAPIHGFPLPLHSLMDFPPTPCPPFPSPPSRGLSLPQTSPSPRRGRSEGYSCKGWGEMHIRPLFKLRPCPSYSGHRDRINWGPDFNSVQM